MSPHRRDPLFMFEWEGSCVITAGMGIDKLTEIMQKLPARGRAMKDYFVYLPESPAGSAWECAAVSAGRTRVLPNSAYPPYRHPLDHHFTWADGRILQTYTVVFIVEGTGLFESAVSLRAWPISAGTVFVVFPGFWHRYSPDVRTGWVEHWIECCGPAFDRAARSLVVCPEKPVVPTGLDPDLLLCFERCHVLAQHGAPGDQPILATLGLHILAVLDRAARCAHPLTQRIDQVIQRAQALMSERCDRPLRMEDLAQELNVGYSHFRQAFRERTGLSPKQYHLQLRLRKAQEFLANTSKSLKEIAEILGFDSPYHLSHQFKARLGAAPDTWRRGLVRRR